MQTEFRLPEWDAFAAMDEDAIPLFAGALRVAQDEYPQLQPEGYQTRMLAYAAQLQQRLMDVHDVKLRLRALNAFLFDELGFAGDDADYYDPRNSYLNEVLDRRLGNPVSLAIVQIELARHVGLPLQGVSFPGHFLVQMRRPDGVLVLDPFNNGRPLQMHDLRQRAQPQMRGELDDDMLLDLLRPASSGAILIRVLRNLLGIYTERGDWERTARCADRVLKLAPDNSDALRERGLAYLQLGHRHGAHDDLIRYLRQNPDAPDAFVLRERMIDAGASPRRAH